MQTTPNYGFNIVEGTDIVNPLVDLNPNFTSLDAILKAISDKAFDRASCVKSGTNHAVTRTDTDRNLIIFTATGDWNTGDSMTVDGSPVSVYLPDGSAPLTGSFVINTEVIMVLNGSRVTIYTSQKLPDYEADDIIYDPSGTNLTSVDVQSAIDEIANSTMRGGVSITRDGIRTWNQLLSDLFAMADPSKITSRAILVYGTYVYHMVNRSPAVFHREWLNSSGKMEVLEATVSAASTLRSYNDGITTDQSNNVPSAGVTIYLFY